MIGWLHKANLVTALIQEMEAYEEYLKARWPQSAIIVTEDFVAVVGGGHVTDSQHYSGRAVDFHVQGVPIADAWLSLERFRFTGIGYYPFWKTPGFHADVRLAPYRARWSRDSSGNYVEFGANTLRSLGGAV